MDIGTADRLRQINNDFYRDHAASFSETREHPWQGWHRCLEVLREMNDDKQDGDFGFDLNRFSVLDLACGNQRLKSFLKNELPEAEITYYAVDYCDALIPSTFEAVANSDTPATSATVVNYQSLDILELLHKRAELGESLAAPVCDLSVSFGFMHHVPLYAHREEVLRSLIRQTRRGGYVIVTLWQFLKDQVLREKALVTHERALQELGLEQLGENDFLLGWKDMPGAYRYCHHFSDDEIDRLVAAVAEEATVVSRFSADGKSQDLNAYLVLRVD